MKLYVLRCIQTLKMKLSIAELDCSSFLRVLRACTECNDMRFGGQVHSLTVKCGFSSNGLVGTALADLYSKCGLVKEARLAFGNILEKDLVSWNVMVSCYVSHCREKEAFQAFESLRRDGFQGDEFTFSSLLKSCGSLVFIKLGKQVHGLALKSCLALDVFVSSALVDMYMKCGDVEDGRWVFDSMQVRNVVSWNSIIVGYGTQDGGKEAVKLLNQMLQRGFKPDETTLASVLSSCANLAAVNETTQIHNYLIKTGFQAFVSVGNALIIAYAKCGSIHSACQAFCLVSKPDLVTWSSMVSSYAFHGLAKEAMETFNRMLQEGVRPDKVAILGVVSACSHAGLVKEGLQYFNSMMKEYHIRPGSEHYACLVDLFGRAGHIADAHRLATNLPFEPGGDVLGALIGACKLHGHTSLARWVADELFLLEPHKPVNYKLLSNIHAALECWGEVAKVRRMMRSRCGCKAPGCSWIEIHGAVKVFVSSDIRSCGEAAEINIMLEILTQFIKDKGCTIDASFTPDQMIQGRAL